MGGFPRDHFSSTWVFTFQINGPKKPPSGGLAEWSNAPVLKTDEGESPPRVRIPEPPPFFIFVRFDRAALSGFFLLFLWVCSLSSIFLSFVQLRLYSFLEWYGMWYILWLYLVS